MVRSGLREVMPSLTRTFSEVPFDRVCADEQLRTDLLIRQTVAGQPCDLSLSSRQLVTRADRLFAHLLPGGNQLAATTFGEGMRTHPGEHLVALAEGLP